MESGATQRQKDALAARMWRLRAATERDEYSWMLAKAAEREMACAVERARLVEHAVVARNEGDNQKLGFALLALKHPDMTAHGHFIDTLAQLGINKRKAQRLMAKARKQRAQWKADADFSAASQRTDDQAS